MAKFHINKHGVPAPCKATKGNCPYGGESSHYNTQEEAQDSIDKKNEKEYGIMPEMKTRSKEEIEKKGKHLVSLIDKRKNKVKEPEFLGSSAFDATEDIDTLYEIGQGGYITLQEHNPVVNVKRMFDHLRNKKLDRYDSEKEYPLQDFPFNLYGNLDRLEKVLEEDYFLHSKFDDPNFEPTQDDLDEAYGSDSYSGYMELHEEPRLGGNTPSEIWRADIIRHEQMYHYTQDLAIEYATDFENKVQHGDYSLEEEEIIAEQYKKALADKVGERVPSYEFDKDTKVFDENKWRL
ncbi:MAG TPA: hypothetical protein GXZ90_05075 [Clostridiales bacterium]|nr:hypothetical protein [Clostridiales bacterium]